MYLKITVSVVRFRPWAPRLKALKHHNNSEHGLRGFGETLGERVIAR
jgi:hypothetical protein